MFLVGGKASAKESAQAKAEGWCVVTVKKKEKTPRAMLVLSCRLINSRLGQLPSINPSNSPNHPSHFTQSMIHGHVVPPTTTITITSTCRNRPFKFCLNVHVPFCFIFFMNIKILQLLNTKFFDLSLSRTVF